MIPPKGTESVESGSRASDAKVSYDNPNADYPVGTIVERADGSRYIREEGDVATASGESVPKWREYGETGAARNGGQGRTAEQSHVFDGGGKVVAPSAAETRVEASTRPPRTADATTPPKDAESVEGGSRASVASERPLDDPDFKAWAKKRGVAPTQQKREQYDRERVKTATKMLSRWIKGVKVKMVNAISPEKEMSSATDGASKVSHPRMASIRTTEDAMPGQTTAHSIAKALKQRKSAENAIGDYISKNDEEINPRHIVSDLGRAIGMSRTSPSLYRSFTSDDGTVFSIRLSNHRANAANYVKKDNQSKINLSIAVIRKRSGDFKADDRVELREYEYNESDLTVADVKKIATSLKDALSNKGSYTDTTGKLITENVSPVRHSIKSVTHNNGSFDPQNPDIRYLRDGEKIVGSFNPKTGEVQLAKGASVDTVAHELGWHAAYDWAKKNAGADKRAKKLYDKMREYADNAPDDVKNAVRNLYGVLGGDAFADEVGAALFSREKTKALADAIATKFGVRPRESP